MSLFTHKSNDEAAYRVGQDTADRAVREGTVAEHEQQLTEHNAHPEVMRGFRDRLGR